MGQDVVAYSTLWQEGSLCAVDDVVEQRSQSVCQNTGCQLVVRIEQRDGSVAGWESSVKAFPLVEQRDAALCHVRGKLSWAVWLKGFLEHSGELWPQLFPEALIEFVGQAVKAWSFTARQGAKSLGEVLKGDTAVSSCALSLVLPFFIFIIINGRSLTCQPNLPSQQYQRTAKGNLWDEGIHSTTHNRGTCFAMASDACVT